MALVKALRSTLIFVALGLSAHAAPKRGCEPKGKPVQVGTVGWGVDTVVTVGEAAYAVATDTVRVWDRKGYSFPGPTYPLVPVAGGDVIALQAPKFEGYEQGAWSARSWLGVGDLVVAVGPHPSGTGIVVARWRLPDPSPSVLQFETGKLSKSDRPVGPSAAAIGDTLAVVWTEPKDRLLPTATQQVHQNEARIMATVVDLKTEKVAKPVEVVEGEWLTSAFGNVVPNADSTGFVVLQLVRKADAPAEEGTHPLSWRPFSTSGVLGEVKGELPWEAWQSVLPCGGKWVVQDISYDKKVSRFSVIVADPSTGTVTTTATPALGDVGCHDGVAAFAWVVPDVKTRRQAVRFALPDGKPPVGANVTTVENFAIGHVAVASNKVGPVVLWTVMSKTADHKDRADVFTQQMTCAKVGK